MLDREQDEQQSKRQNIYTDAIHENWALEAKRDEVIERAK